MGLECKLMEAAHVRNKQSVMRKVQPLYLRLYNEPHLIALVRLLGYPGLPAPEARERLKPLNEQYGEERMKAAVRELVEVVAAQDQPVVRLTERARKLAWQLLGPPPEDAGVAAPTPGG
jgi:hypothetical protein